MTPPFDRVHDVLFHWAERTPQSLAFADLTSGRAFTFDEAAAFALSLADAIGTQGATLGQRVAIVGENGPAFALCYLACVLRGAWPVLVNARLSRSEIDAIFAHARPGLALFTSGDSQEAKLHAEAFGAMNAPRVAHLRGQFEFLGIDAATPYPASEFSSGLNNSLHSGAKSASIQGDVAALIYTSGTTGTPKGVMLSHENLLFVARTSAELRQLQPSDRVCGMLPISHVYGLSSVFLATLYAGASLHFLPRFQAPLFCDTLEKHGLTVLQTVPAVYFKLLSYFRESTTRSLPSLRYLHCGGSALDPTLKADVERALGLPLHNGYGLTETSPTIAQTRRLAPRTDCSVGEPVPGVEVRILPDGELCVRGPGVMLGYYLDDEKTREVLSPDGWFHTGDLAALGADGALHILGRKKDLIVRSGFNVYPSEVESALLRHPDVEAAAVVGVCEESNETVVAFVVRTSPSNACNEDLLRTFVSAFIAPYKRPSHVFFVDELPQTGSGKVRKHELVEMAHALLKAKEPRA